MKCTVTNGVHIAEVPVKDFSIAMVDAAKKTAAKDNYCNAGFFAVFSEGGQAFTLPVAHIVCDYEAEGKWTRHYCEERGSFDGDKFTFDASKWSYQNEFCGKAISTLVIKDGEAAIIDTVAAPACDYAISGVPIMRDGEDVIFASYVTGQGWGGSSLYATWHIFAGLKDRADTIYVMAAKTTTSNMIKTAEAYKKFKALGFRDVIKLDGGGSTYFKAGGKVTATSENRRINSIILFGEEEKPMGKEKIELPVLKRGDRGNSVKALQLLLNGNGCACGEADGIWGSKTQDAVVKYQKSKKLKQSGEADTETWSALLL